MGKNYEVLSQEAISYMCGLLRNMASVADGIDDLNLKTDGTFSSVKIDNLIKQVLSDGKDYADQICASLVKLTCQKTTVQPTLDNSEINVIYLYSADGNAPFEQWLKISDTELIDMGSTTISLDNYYDKATADNKFSLKTSVEDIVNIIGTDTLSTTATTLKGAINEVKGIADDKVDKTDIAITLSDTSTDDEVASAKAVYDMVDNIKGNLTSFTNVTDLNDFKGSSFMIGSGTAYNNECVNVPDGVSGAFCVEFIPYAYGDYYGVQRLILVQAVNGQYIIFERSLDNAMWKAWQKVITDKDIVTTIGSSSTDKQVPSAKAVYDKYKGTIYNNEDLNLITETGLYVCIGGDTYGETYHFPVLDNGYLYHANFPAEGYCTQIFIPNGVWGGDLSQYIRRQKGGTWTNWVRNCNTTVADSSGTVTLPDGITGVISYKVVNGICYVSIQGLADGLTGTQVCTFTGLPKADIYINIGIEYLGNRVGTIYTDDGVTFYVHKTTTNSGYGSFSYPVAES